MNLPGRVTQTSWDLPPGLSVEQWLALGEELKNTERSIMWWLGDWLKHGDLAYGEMAAQALEPDSPSYSTMVNARNVATKVEAPRRRLSLSWGHHAEVAALTPDKQDLFLDRASAENLSVHDLRREVKRAKLAAEREAPPGKFRVLYADPPWPGEEGSRKALTIAEMCSWPVGSKAEDDAVLFLWVPSAMLFEAPAVVDAWGFEYRASFVWQHPPLHDSDYNAVEHHLLLVGTRGTCLPDNKDQLSVQPDDEDPKPESFRVLIDTMYPQGARIEIFSQTKPPAPWVAWT